MDVWVETTEENADRLVRVERVWVPCSEARSRAVCRSRSSGAYGTSALRIEILTSVTYVSFGECYSSRVEEELEDGTPIHFIGLEKLKENKRASGRHKDLETWRIFHSRGGPDVAL